MAVQVRLKKAQRARRAAGFIKDSDDELCDPAWAPGRSQTGPADLLRESDAEDQSSEEGESLEKRKVLHGIFKHHAYQQIFSQEFFLAHATLLLLGCPSGAMLSFVDSS